MVNEVVKLDNGDFEVFPKEEPYVFARDLEIELLLLKKEQPSEKRREGTKIYVPSVREHE